MKGDPKEDPLADPLVQAFEQLQANVRTRLANEERRDCPHPPHRLVEMIQYGKGSRRLCDRCGLVLPLPDISRSLPFRLSRH